MKVLRKTTTICPTCFREIPATVFERPGGVFMRKTCPEHGTSEVLLEKDSDVYRRLNDNRTGRRKRFNSLTITLTHKCNNSCVFCYLPEREAAEKPTEEIMAEISGFSGRHIRLSGGEPTLREDLSEIIRYSADRGKLPAILTNGIKLSDPGYVSRLESAGLYSAHLSFNSLNREVLKRIESDNLDAKLTAIRNLRGSGIKIALSFMAIGGETSKEIPEIIGLCLRTPGIRELRIRSAARMGRHGSAERIFLSELIDELAGAIGFDREQLLLEYFIQEKIKRIKGNPESVLPCTFNVMLFRKRKPEMLSDGISPERFYRTSSKKLLFLCNLLKRRKTLALRLLSGVILGKAGKDSLSVYIRSWPDKHTIDLDNIGRCLTCQLTNDNKRLPFCYALVMNERDGNV
jgi:uncharacterized radical SAM superfamily Fe-S cluster-containing enzyme